MYEPGNVKEKFSKIYKKNIKPYITEKFPKNELTNPVYYELERNSNRFRSATPILLARIYEEEIERVLPISAASEIIWAIAIVEDDITDEDERRNERNVAWKKFGTRKSIISIQYCLVKAFEILDSLNGLTNSSLYRKIFNQFLDSYQKLISSFHLERKNRNNLDISMENILKIYYYKTSTGVNATYTAGLLLTEANEAKSLEKFAKKLAYAGQIKNDLDDFLNKNFSDIQNGYVTYPILKLYKKLDGKDKKAFRSNFPAKNKENSLRMYKLFKKYNMREECIKEGNEFVKSAFESIKNLKSCDEKKILMDPSDMLPVGKEFLERLKRGNLKYF